MRLSAIKANSFNAKTNLADAGFRKRKFVELENLRGADLVKANYFYSLCWQVINSGLADSIRRSAA